MCQQVKKVQFLCKENNPISRRWVVDRVKLDFFNQIFYIANLNNLTTELF